MNDNLRAQQDVWDEWLHRVRVGVTDRDPHTIARAAAVIEELQALAARSALARAGTRAKILDVGCGDGMDSVQFARFGQVVATDLGVATIADATERYAGSGVRFVAGDFLTLPFEEAPFDAIVTVETIAHVYDQPGFVRRFAELLRPGGHLIVTTQNRDVYEYLGHPPAKGYLRRWLNRAELVALLSRDFHVERVRTVSPADPGDVRPALDGRAPPPHLRLVYSYHLNRLVERLRVPRRWLDRARERAGIARTLVAVATPLPAGDDRA